MTKNRKSIVGLAALLILASTATMPTTIAMAGTGVDEDAVKLEATADFEINSNSAQAISTYASSLGTPSLVMETFNTAVKYSWYAGSGGNALYMWNGSPYAYEIINKATYIEPMIVQETGTSACNPRYWAAKTYNSVLNTYSDNFTSIAHEVDMGDYVNIRYGYDSKYVAVEMYKYWLPNMGAKVPTSYDKEYFIWKHHSSNGHRIMGTIKYGEECANLEVTIPLIGYKTSSVVVNGETFYLRTGPNKCSIKAKSSNVYAADIEFAFGID